MKKYKNMKFYFVPAGTHELKQQKPLLVRRGLLPILMLFRQSKMPASGSSIFHQKNFIKKLLTKLLDAFGLALYSLDSSTVFTHLHKAFFAKAFFAFLGL